MVGCLPGARRDVAEVAGVEVAVGWDLDCVAVSVFVRIHEIGEEERKHFVV